MATSSFFHSVNLTTPEQLKRFADVIEQAGKKPRPTVKMSRPLVKLSDDELKKLLSTYDNEVEV